MKKSFHVFFLFTLMAFFATMANAETAELQTDPNTGDKFVNIPVDGRTLEVDIPGELPSFKVHVDEYELGSRIHGYLTLNAPEGFLLQVSGLSVSEIVDLEALIVEDVESNRTLWGNDYYPSQTVLSTGRAVFLKFETHVANVTLDLTVTPIDVSEKHAITIASTSNGTVTSTPTEAAYGEDVELSINPATDYMLASMTVVDNSGKAVIHPAGWYSGNTVSFTMPMEEVTVTPVFVPEDYSNLSINMPVESNADNIVKAYIPEEAKSFKVYDFYGEDPGAFEAATGVMVLYAPSGYKFEVKGNANWETGVYGQLMVADGESWSDAALVEERAIMGGSAVVDPVMSTGNAITILFIAQSMQMETALPADLDLTVSLVKTTQYAAVTVEEVGTTTTATIAGAYDGNDAVNITNSIPVDAVVLNRTFSTAGYSTITLPFAIDKSNVSGLTHVYAFDAMGSNNGKKEVQMVEVSSLEANTPYIIEVGASSLEFTGGVTLVPTDAAVVRKGDWEFRGTFQKTIWDANHPDLGTVYGYSAEAIGNVSIGQFVKAAAGAFIRPFRAYLIYNPADGIPEDGSALHKSAGSTLGAAEALPDYIDVVVVNCDANGQEHKKVIGVIDTRTGEFKMQQDYDLKGRKLINGQQKARGAYYGKMKVSK